MIVFLEVILTKLYCTKHQLPGVPAAALVLSCTHAPGLGAVGTTLACCHLQAVLKLKLVDHKLDSKLHMTQDNSN